MLVLARADKSKVLILSLIVTAVKEKKPNTCTSGSIRQKLIFETLKYFKLIDKLFYQLFMMRSFEFT